MEPADHVLAALRAALRASWSEQTSNDPAWSPGNPASGQCAVTALVVQDLLGGELIRGVVEGQSHYWNRIDGADIDLTAEQFAGSCVPLRITPRDRDYVLAFPETVRRYRLLRERLSLAGYRPELAAVSSD